MAEDDGTAATLDQLEAVRVAVETEYLDCMHGLEVRADALRAAVSALELGNAAGGAAIPPSESILSAASPAALLAPAAERPDEAPPAEWNPPVGGIRGWLASWLLGDLQPVIDQRQSANDAALAELRADLGSLRAEVAAALDRAQQAATAQLDSALVGLGAVQEQQRVAATEARAQEARRWRGVGEALDHAVEGLTLATRLSERLRAVVDAKDAEGLQRAVQGPSLQVEVIVDELTRRQEALLAQLVGRRQELDKLIESVSNGD